MLLVLSQRGRQELSSSTLPSADAAGHGCTHQLIHGNETQGNSLRSPPAGSRENICCGGHG